MHDKIRKLLAMAEHPGSDPNEAANAAAMAARLAAEHNIDLESISRVEGRPKAFGRAMSDWHVKRTDDNAIALIGSWVARLYGCKILIHSWKSQCWVSFAGQEHNRALALAWTKYLWDACLRANTEHARERKYGSPAMREVARRSFRIHFANAVARRLKEKLDEMRKPPAGSDSRALVVAAWFDQERKEVELWVEQNEGGEREPIKERDYKLVVDAAVAGQRAGEQVSLNEQLEAEAKRKAIR